MANKRQVRQATAGSLRSRNELKKIEAVIPPSRMEAVLAELALRGRWGKLTPTNVHMVKLRVRARSAARTDTLTLCVHESRLSQLLQTVKSVASFSVNSGYFVRAAIERPLVVNVEYLLT